MTHHETQEAFNGLLEGAFLGLSLLRVQMSAHELLVNHVSNLSKEQRHFLADLASHYDRLAAEDRAIQYVLETPSVPEEVRSLAFTTRAHHLVVSPVEMVEPYLIVAYVDTPLRNLLPANQLHSGEHLMDLPGDELLSRVVPNVKHCDLVWVKAHYRPRQGGRINDYAGLPLFYLQRSGPFPGLFSLAAFLAEPYKSSLGSYNRLVVHRCVDFFPDLRPNDSFNTLPEVFWQLPSFDFTSAVAGR